MQVHLAKLKELTRHLDWLAIVISSAFLIGTVFVPSVKVFFVLAFTYFIALTYQYGLAKALIYSSPILGYFNIGQIHQILVIPVSAIISDQYLEGRHLSWLVSPFLMISVVALLLFFWWQRKLQTKFHFLQHEKMIIVATGCALLSALYGSLIPGLSMFQVLTPLVGIIWIMYLITLGKNIRKKEWQKIIVTLTCVILLLIFFEGLVVVLQTLWKSSLGLLIEATQMAPVFGLGADETSGTFRPFGLSIHPNGLANRQLTLLLSVLFLWSYKGKKKNSHPSQLVWLALGLSAMMIILSLSRAAYIAVTVVTFFICLRHPNLINQTRHLAIKALAQTRLWHKIILSILTGGLIFKLSQRLLSSLYAFSEAGGVTTRLVQYQEAWEVFKRSPFLGIGDQMFIPTSFHLFPKGVMSYFPENVHSGFLLLLIERGLLGFVFYVLFFWLFFYAIRKSQLQKINKTMLYSGLISGFVMMAFHPEKNFFSLLILLGLAVVHYEKKADK